jgi:hypothetical protein
MATVAACRMAPHMTSESGEHNPMKPLTPGVIYGNPMFQVGPSAAGLTNYTRTRLMSDIIFWPQPRDCLRWPNEGISRFTIR